MLMGCSVFGRAPQFRAESNPDGSSGWRFPWFSPSSRRRRTQCGQGTQAREVVGRHRQSQQLVDLLQALQHDLADGADRLAPAEALLDSRALAPTDRVSGMSRRAPIDRTASSALGVLLNLRRDVRYASGSPGIMVKSGGLGSETWKSSSAWSSTAEISIRRSGDHRRSIGRTRCGLPSSTEGMLLSTS